MRTLRRPLAIIALSLIGAACANQDDPSTGTGPGPGLERPPAGPAIWPLAGTAIRDADVNTYPYGPRKFASGEYDFHAGIDMNTPIGTPVHAILPGVVARVYTCSVLIDHGNGQFTSSLHLSSKAVVAGQQVAQGQQIGRSGDCDANVPHLHLTYMKNLPSAATDERYSRNPLEILNHGTTPLTARFAGDTAWVRVRIQHNRVQKATLVSASGESRTLDYSAVVALGSINRNARVHNGVGIDASSPQGGFFELKLYPAPGFALARVQITDFAGEVVLDAARDR